MRPEEATVRAALLEVYRPEAVETWLQARVPLLEGQRPLDLIDRGEGLRVLAAIQQLADGVFV